MGMCSLIWSIISQLLDWMVLAASNGVNISVQVSFCAADPFGLVRARLPRYVPLISDGSELKLNQLFTPPPCAQPHRCTHVEQNTPNTYKSPIAQLRTAFPRPFFSYFLLFYIYIFFLHTKTLTHLKRGLCLQGPRQLPADTQASD